MPDRNNLFARNLFNNRLRFLKPNTPPHLDIPTARARCVAIFLGEAEVAGYCKKLQAVAFG